MTKVVELLKIIINQRIVSILLRQSLREQYIKLIHLVDLLQSTNKSLVKTLISSHVKMLLISIIKRRRIRHQTKSKKQRNIPSKEQIILLQKHLYLINKPYLLFLIYQCLYTLKARLLKILITITTLITKCLITINYTLYQIY